MPHTFVDADTLARLTDDIRRASSDRLDSTILGNAPLLDEFALVHPCRPQIAKKGSFQ
ncbi:hypothetical protein ABIA13_006425 [Sinorhizobium fredii]